MTAHHGASRAWTGWVLQGNEVTAAAELATRAKIVTRIIIASFVPVARHINTARVSLFGAEEYATYGVRYASGNPVPQTFKKSLKQKACERKQERVPKAVDNQVA